MDATETQDAPAQRLSEIGVRSTPQREVVYNVILTQRDHPTADDVFARVKAEMPTISLATVYNCLEKLVQCNLVKPVNVDRGSTRYCPNLLPHAHFHNVDTGTVQDIPLPECLLKQVTSVLPEGFAAGSVEITFRGTVKPGR